MNPCRFKLFLIDARHVLEDCARAGEKRRDIAFFILMCFLKDNFLFDLIHVRST